MATALQRYAKTATMAASSQVSEGPWVFPNYLLRFLHVAVLLSLWRVLLAGRDEVAGMSLATLLTYTLIAEVFAEQLGCSARLEDAAWEGTLVTRLLQPLPMVGIFAAEMAGRWLVDLALFSAPLLLAAPLLGVNPGPSSATAGGWFLISLGLAIVVGLAVDLLFGALFLWLRMSLWLMTNLRVAIRRVLSGWMVPMALLPWGLGDLFSYLPFASMASAPLSIYTGTGDPVRLLLLQAGWASVLWPLAHRAWQASRERMVSYGG